jgi:nicotinate-nucleotide pyrophosphorylase (carboxylating)
MKRLDALLEMVLDEDVGYGDVTTLAVVPADALGRAVVVGREPFVLSGSYPFQRVFQLLDPATETRCSYRDGDLVPAELPLIEVSGPVQALLTGERCALNLLQRLAGVATATQRMVEALRGTSCRLLDTRKTTPLWRQLEKQAVLHGGGCNHRFGLFDGVLIKDNHLAAAGGVAEALRRARARVPHTLKIEVEVDTLEQFEEAQSAGADIILLDNFTLEMLRAAVARNRSRAVLEASGGVTWENVRDIAQTGVDFISSGALTHSARAIDISFELLG